MSNHLFDGAPCKIPFEETFEVERASQNSALVSAFVRGVRDGRLAETDFYALTDVTMTEDMAAYRQALRDITDHADFPYLDEADWPTKPE